MFIHKKLLVEETFSRDDPVRREENSPFWYSNNSKGKRFPLFGVQTIRRGRDFPLLEFNLHLIEEVNERDKVALCAFPIQNARHVFGPVELCNVAFNFLPLLRDLPEHADVYFCIGVLKYKDRGCSISLE